VRQPSFILPPEAAQDAALGLRVLRADPYEGMVLETTLDPSEPFLHDHRIDGVPVLPGVMGIEIFARAALAPGMPIDSVAGVRFEAPLKCYRDVKRPAQVTVRLVDGAGGMRAHCELTSLASTPDSPRAPQTKRHFAATLALARSPSRPPSSPRLETGARLGRVSREDLYRTYFHDASFRVLQGTEVARGGKALVGTLAPGLPALFKTPGARAITAPRLLELCFQTAGVIEIGSTRKLGLPSNIEEVRVHDGADDAAPRFAKVGVTREGGIDVERVVESPRLIAEDYLTAEERHLAGADGALGVTRVWCVKEAVVKAVRKGLRLPASAVVVAGFGAEAENGWRRVKLARWPGGG
jgi:hypothetical protein